MKYENFNIAKKPYNVPKNRYKDILPYDNTRVKLKPITGVIGSDYINGNYVPGYFLDTSYISLQGPTPNTTGDFWRCVWEHHSHVIAMVARLTENGKPKVAQVYFAVDS